MDGSLLATSWFGSSLFVWPLYYLFDNNDMRTGPLDPGAVVAGLYTTIAAVFYFGAASIIGSFIAVRLLHRHGPWLNRLALLAVPLVVVAVWISRVPSDQLAIEAIAQLCFGVATTVLMTRHKPTTA